MDWALIIAIIALVVAVMALPTLFQMIWGRPKLKPEVRSQSFYGLECRIQNVPINSKLIKFFRVKRDTVQDLSVSISIDNNNGNPDDLLGNQIYCDLQNRTLHFNDISSSHIRLPSSIYPAFMHIIRAGKISPENIIRTYIIDADGERGAELKEGSYLLHINIRADDEQITMTKNFRVNNHEPWVMLE